MVDGAEARETPTSRRLASRVAAKWNSGWGLFLGVTWLILWAPDATLGRPEAESVQKTSSTSKFSWDHNASFFFSMEGVDLAGTPRSHVQPSDRIPRNYLGFEWMGTLGTESKLRRFFGSWPLTTWVANPHLEFDFNPYKMLYPIRTVRDREGGQLVATRDRRYLPDRGDNRSPRVLDAPPITFESGGMNINYGENTIRIKPVVYDFWVRFEPEQLSRSSLLLGHFPIPYGLDPSVKPRAGEFIQPVEVVDLGFKEDWGISWRAPLGKFDYVLAATAGIGLGIHSPNWWGDGPGSFLVSGRFGTPSYRRVNYAVSGLYGRTPTMMGDHLIVEEASTKWRVNVDLFWRHLTNTVVVFQTGFGGNEDTRGDADTADEDVLSGQIYIDHVLRWHPNLNFKGQFQVVLYDIGQQSQNLINMIFEVAYSLTDALTLRVDYVHDFQMPLIVAEADDRIYLSLNYFR